MKLNAPLLFALVTILAACSGRNASAISEKTGNEQVPVIAIGDTVSGIGKDIWIVFQCKNKDYWYGSNGRGVFRYDGKTLLQFTKKDGLIDDSIRGIQEDNQGNVFITTMGGINKFDGQKFTALPVVESNEWKLDPNDLWFSILGGTGEYGPYRYDGKVLHHLKFPKHYLEEEYYKDFPDKPWSPYEVYTIYKDRKGNIWFGTSNFGLCRYDGKSISWLYEEHLTLIEGGGSFGIRSILEDKEGKFWFCNTSYRYNIHPDSLVKPDRTLINYQREKGIVNLKAPEGKDKIYFMSVVEDDQGNMWMVTYSQGVWKYDGKTITHFSVKDGSEDITLFSIYKDKNGGLWLGTHEAGVYQFNGESFEKFRL